MEPRALQLPLDATVGGTIEGDALSYDPFSAAAERVWRPRGAEMLPDFDVERVFATGHSQSAGRLAVYLNNVHPLNPIGWREDGPPTASTR